MSRFENCPQNEYLFWSKSEHCPEWLKAKCEGCNLYTAYHIGKADALKEVLSRTSMKGDKKNED